MECINYNIIIQLNRFNFISKVDLEQKPHCFKKKIDQCTCEEATGYSRQYVHKILLLINFNSLHNGNHVTLMIWWCVVKDIGNYKNPSISQQISIDSFKSLGDHEAKMKIFDKNKTNSVDDINHNAITIF